MDTLSSLLREQGYKTYALSGVTRHFDNKDLFFERLLRYENFLGEEDIKKLCAKPPVCGWGLADSVLYALGLDILQENRTEPVLLTIETANTHPGFYHTLPEESFPPNVRSGNSRLLRSLYEADVDLLYFFQRLRERNLFDEQTLLLITADHSPNHGNEYMRMFNTASLFPDMIPCIFITSDADASPFRGIDRNAVCSQLDLLPTLTEVLGLRRAEHILGRSLFCPGPRAVISK
jgi:phosphoglycerol transferase MdoB-like AlkP superfamily enzyme